MPEKPHPLADALAELLAALPLNARDAALVLGAGSGRNIHPLRKAGVYVDILEENQARAQAVAEAFSADLGVRVLHGSYAELRALERSYVAALSTHALLHGSPQSVSAAVEGLAEILAPAANVMFTLGSTQDPRFGKGQRIDEQTWAPLTGSEIGVPHVYYDEAATRALLRPFDLLSLERRRTREVVGTWAHDPRRMPEIVHWFVRAASSARA